MLALLGLFVIGAAATPLPHKVIGESRLTGREEAMIIALPGAGETANIYCDVFSGGRYRRLAQDRGYVLVCLSSMGLGLRFETHEEQIIRLRDRLVRRFPKVRKVFLTGYSLGGRGALLMALRHPDKFDGVAAVVPWFRLPNDRTRIFPEIVHRVVQYPHEVFIAQAKLDFFLPFGRRDMRGFVTAGEGRVHKRRYLTDHWLVVAASAKDLFNFFDRQRPIDQNSSLMLASSGE